MSPIFVQATTITTFLLLSLLLSTPTTTTADIVIDFDRKPLEAGSYYIGLTMTFNQSGSQDSFGALTMYNKGTPNCASFIVGQTITGALHLYIPLKLTPENSTEKNNIYTSSNVNIAFKFLRPEPACLCRYTTVWTVSGTENGNMVVVDGKEGSDDSWFTLERTDDLFEPHYRILYGNKKVLYDRQSNGEILYGLDKGHPLQVYFLKIDGDTSSSTTLPGSLEMPHLSFTQGLLAN